MLIIDQGITRSARQPKPATKRMAKGLKTKCCKNYKKNQRCKRCPCFDLLKKAS